MQPFVPAVMVFVFGIICVASVTKIILAVVNRRSLPSKGLDEISQRLERMEQAIDSTAIEVERMSEAQRFTARVLAERGPANAAALRPPEQVITPH